MCCMVKWWTCQAFCMYYAHCRQAALALWRQIWSGCRSACKLLLALILNETANSAVQGDDSNHAAMRACAAERIPCYALLGGRQSEFCIWLRLQTASRALARCAGWGNLSGRKKPQSSFCKPLWSLCLKTVDRYFKLNCRIASLWLQLCSALHYVCVEQYQMTIKDIKVI